MLLRLRSGRDVAFDESKVAFLEEAEVEEASGSELKEWLGYVSKPEIETTISDEVEVQKRFLRKARTIFTVRTKAIDSGNVTNCKRSMREFARLRTAVQKRFPGALVPPLPEKNVGGARSIEHIKFFIEMLTNNPVFRNDAAYKSFCSVKTQKFNDEVVENLESKTQGSIYWAELTHSTPLPPKPIATVKEFLREIKMLQDVYTKLRGDMESASKLMEGQAKSQRAISQVFFKWKAKEASSFTHLRGSVTDPTRTWTQDDDVVHLTSMIDTMSASSEQRAAAFDFEASHTLFEAQKAIQAELLLLGELELMAKSVLSELRLHAAQMLKSAALQTQQQASATDAEKSAALTKKLESVKHKIREEQLARKQCFRGLVFEMHRFRFERTARASKLFQVLAEVQKKNATAFEETIWSIQASAPSVPHVSHLACLGDFAEQHAQRSSESSAAYGLAQGDDDDDPDAFMMDESDFNCDVETTAFEESLVDNETLATTSRKSKRKSLRVMYNFEAQHDNEVNLLENQVVEVIEDHGEEDGWCTVQGSDGKVGLAPASYLSELSGSASTNVEQDESKESNGSLNLHQATDEQGEDPSSAAPSGLDVARKQGGGGLLDSIQGFDRSTLARS
mmetsp:Transcript_21410/g.37889  ORF Transcript_21410/g.37889 Transcript_21410/m.37889 type:complete len:622 (-) Transcript_21410:90-1955(-)